MIEPAKKKLSIIYFTTMVGFIFAVLSIVYVFMNYRLTDSVRSHLIESIETEFMPHYMNDDFDVLSKLVEDELFQILDRNGEVVMSVQSSIGFSPTLNESLLDAANGGRQVFETTSTNKGKFLISYFPLDDAFVGRAVHPITAKEVFQKNFLTLVVLALPFLLLIALLSSRYMVNQSLKPISDVMKYQETFSSNVSHELKSPLTSIKGSLEVALRKDRSPEEYGRIIKSALSKIDNIIVLINNLSLMATSKFKPLDLYRESVEVESIMDDIVDKYEPIVYGKNAELILSTQSSETRKISVALECDSTLIRRAIENLLDNAVKYTPSGGTIELSWESDAHHFIFAISNTCPDMAKDELKNLCEPFYRGKNAAYGDIEGRGLGLHVVRHITLSHGGTLTPHLENETFSITMKIPNTLHGKSVRKKSSHA